MNRHYCRIAMMLTGLNLLIGAAALAEPLTDSPTTAPAAREEYLSAVRTFADNVLLYGRDVYGEKHTPLLIDGINIDTHEPAIWLLPEDKAKEWQMPRRWVLSNLASQQNLFRIFAVLSDMTGDPKYLKAAQDATRYMFENYQLEAGLLFWGGHAAIDLNTKQPVGEGRSNGLPGRHELKNNYPFYELMWKVNPQATHKFIDAFWAGHITNWDNLDMNRHGPYKPTPEAPWFNKYVGGPVPFEGDGLSFIHTGSDLFYSAAMLYRVSRFNQALRWGKHLAQRYADVCDPKTGLGSDNYSTEHTKRMQKQFGPEFGDRFTEATVTSIYRNRYRRSAICQLKLYEEIGPKAEEFKDWAIKDLTAYARGAYDPSDNSFWTTLIDGTKLSPADRKHDGYVKADWLEKHPAEPLNLWAYALAWKLTKKPLMWQMSQSIAAGMGLGKIGNPEGEGRKLNMQTTLADPYTVFALLELYGRSRDKAFIDLAVRIGDNLVRKEFHKGFFVTDKDHVYCKFDSVTPLALLYLHVIEKKIGVKRPMYYGSKSLFHCVYEGVGRTYDNDAIYEQLRGQATRRTMGDDGIK